MTKAYRLWQVHSRKLLEREISRTRRQVRRHIINALVQPVIGNLVCQNTSYFKIKFTYGQIRSPIVYLCDGVDSFYIIN